MNHGSLIGQRYSRLRVVSITRTHGNIYAVCQCDCGKTTKARPYDLSSGRQKSCGCLRSETTSKLRTKHALADTPIYRVWQSMLDRCRRKKCRHYKNYGGRGIRVCKRWLKFENFFADMGVRPSPLHTLERKNNNLGYSKSNCAWVTRKENVRNRRVTKLVEIGGDVKPLARWCEEYGLHYPTINSRLLRGWSGFRSIFTPVKQTKHST